MPLPSLKAQFAALLQTPSISCTQPDLDQSNLPVIHLLADWLGQLGFDCRIQPVPDAPRKANLIASLGSGPGGLVLAGHTDTVPCNAERWQHDPFSLTEADGRCNGLGSCGMKGSFPLISEAVEPLLEQPLNERLLIPATAGEESAMGGPPALVADDLLGARHAVIAGPTGLRPLRIHNGILM